MVRVVDYAPADMTITVEAGVALAEIERLTAADNLRLAIDPPLYEGRATIGGVLASNDGGPLRMMHGGPRDVVVGMTIILGDGTVVRSGGRVVKNVAGYGVHRLMVGSGGEYGMIAAVTLKLQPRPETMRLALIEHRGPAEAEDLTARVLGGALRPAMVEWVRPGAELGCAGLAVVLGFEDCREAVAWQLDEVQRAEPTARILGESESIRGYGWLRGWGAGASFRAAMRSSAIWQVFGAAEGCIPLLAHSGSGCVLAQTSGAADIEMLSSMVRDWGGNVIVPRDRGVAGHAGIRAGLRTALRAEPMGC
jgi:glycolate oxidase FAD binding subunit